MALSSSSGQEGEEEELKKVREEVRAALGDHGLMDAVAVAGFFVAITKLVDLSGKESTMVAFMAKASETVRVVRQNSSWFLVLAVVTLGAIVAARYL